MAIEEPEGVGTYCGGTENGIVGCIGPEGAPVGGEVMLGAGALAIKVRDGVGTTCRGGLPAEGNWGPPDPNAGGLLLTGPEMLEDKDVKWSVSVVVLLHS
ncbi:hypothetical protein Acr_21g0007450 [Actinidia rufa]|uniref:Uncharacterized protein n=1 Tax=Actinidia rufa TaxID=165716 RepID=A0A7J0GH64_9ERIC|nr:hypothetical protein Acr_21g0007450 [Actinidia rufa]